MEKELIRQIIEKHGKWLGGEAGGQRADLQRADLQRADLRGADLQRAYLRGVHLQGADLQDADLQRADLRGADLRGADLRGAYLRGVHLQKTILDGINWLAFIGIVPDSKGFARAYKLTTIDAVGPHYPTINYDTASEFENETLDKDPLVDCGEGINLATFAWCLNNKTNDTMRLFMFEFEVNPDNLCCPVASDGKFRVKKCRKIGECNWQGNLINRTEAI